mmetsp:Transcript_61078/g.192081  ORF Transcript_61078/g.192081 Transcript_61078/m.192081 type:complete len:319 (+) Transcript_61078:929-1885(+)
MAWLSMKSSAVSSWRSSLFMTSSHFFSSLSNFRGSSKSSSSRSRCASSEIPAADGDGASHRASRSATSCGCGSGARGSPAGSTAFGGLGSRRLSLSLPTDSGGSQSSPASTSCAGDDEGLPSTVSASAGVCWEPLPPPLRPRRPRRFRALAGDSCSRAPSPSSGGCEPRAHGSPYAPVDSDGLADNEGPPSPVSAPAGVWREPLPRPLWPRGRWPHTSGCGFHAAPLPRAGAQEWLAHWPAVHGNRGAWRPEAAVSSGPHPCEGGMCCSAPSGDSGCSGANTQGLYIGRPGPGRREWLPPPRQPQFPTTPELEDREGL